MAKEKEIVTIEFRYRDVPKGDWDSKHKSKTILIGAYDTLEEAIAEGNKALEVLEKRFKLHVFPEGRGEAKRERFSKNGGCFGYPHRLVTNMAYLQTPFAFYAKIEKFTYGDTDQTIDEVLEAQKRYKEYELSQKED